MSRRQFAVSGAGVTAMGAGSGLAGHVPLAAGEVGTAMERPIAGGEVPGLAWLVARGDATETGAAGVLDLQTGAPMEPDAIFRVASLTKPVTAAAAMILVEEGFLELDEPVDPWLPELANRRVVRRLAGPLEDTVPAQRPITLRDLLTMRMGLGAIFADPASSPLLTRLGELGLAPGPCLFEGSQDEFVRRLSSLPLACHPGERWLYHTGMDVAGVLVSRASGMALGEFMTERIFEPLGMRDTGFLVPPEKRDRFATCYARDAAGRLVVWDDRRGGSPSEPPAMELGGSGLVSTVRDFGAFGRMLLDRGSYRGRRILSPESVALMTTDQIPARVKATSPFFPGFWEVHGWGLGMAVATAPSRVVPHGGRFGWWGGTGTTFFADPKTDTVAVLMYQRMMTSADDTGIGDEFLRLAFAA